MKIISKLINKNYRIGNSKKYIMIHETANFNKGANAEAHYNFFAKPTTDVRNSFCCR